MLSRLESWLSGQRHLLNKHVKDWRSDPQHLINLRRLSGPHITLALGSGRLGITIASWRDGPTLSLCSGFT